MSLARVKACTRVKHEVPMVTDQEWKQVQRVAAKHGLSALEVDALGGELGRDMVYLAFDPDIDRWRAGLTRMQARQERHEANRRAWLGRRLSENGKKGAAVRWAGHV